jgi:hypothetical protein
MEFKFKPEVIVCPNLGKGTSPNTSTFCIYAQLFQSKSAKINEDQASFTFC